MSIRAFWREPLLHFLLLGALLYLLRPVLPEWAPLAPTGGELRVSVEDQARLIRNWHRETGRLPDERTLQALIERHVEGEVLLRQALRMRLHYNDVVTRQRLINNLRFLEPDTALPDAALFQQAVALNMMETDLVAKRRLIQLVRLRIESQVHVTEADLQRHYRANLDRYRHPASYSFEQRFFSRDRDDQDSADVAAKALQQLRSGVQATDPLASPFLHGDVFSALPASRIAEIFGDAAVVSIQQLSPGDWSEPVASVYGHHLFRLESRQDERQRPFDSVRQQVIAEVYAEREAAYLKTWLKLHKRRYRIAVDAIPVGDSA